MLSGCIVLNIIASSIFFCFGILKVDFFVTHLAFLLVNTHDDTFMTKSSKFANSKCTIMTLLRLDLMFISCLV